MRPRIVPLGLLVLGLFLLAGSVAAFVRAAGAPVLGEGREVLWYPTGAAAACAIYSKTYRCESTPMGNVNEGGRVVARSVPLMASMEGFRWTVDPEQVQAANRRSQAAYLACVRTGRSGCPEPVAKVPSWNSGMAARWAPGFPGAYPEGVDPRARFSVAQLPWVLLVAGVVFLAWGGWLFANAPAVRAK